MDNPFSADCRPVLIGSLPLADHGEALDWVLRYTPEIPLWVQLPARKSEGMIAQFLPGMPGRIGAPGSESICADGEPFEAELLGFYEEYLEVTEGRRDLMASRFALAPQAAEGFFVFMDRIASLASAPLAVKGQITGPITLTTAVTDQERKAIFFDERLRDAAVKLLALKARWQVRKLSALGKPVLLFLDEPALAGFGSSGFASISRSDVLAALTEIVDAILDEGGLPGIHVCANTDWSLVLESRVRIVNFDAYSYVERFFLYAEPLQRFVASGGTVAWGIVPTLPVIDEENVDTLFARWQELVRRAQGLGLDRTRLLSGSLITPSCGTGSLDRRRAQKVLHLTAELSARIRKAAESC